MVVFFFDYFNQDHHGALTPGAAKCPWSGHIASQSVNADAIMADRRVLWGSNGLLSTVNHRLTLES